MNHLDPYGDGKSVFGVLKSHGDTINTAISHQIFDRGFGIDKLKHILFKLFAQALLCRADDSASRNSWGSR